MEIEQLKTKADIYLRNAQFDKALEFYSEAIKKSNSDDKNEMLELFSKRTLTYLRMERYEGACISATDSLKISPKNIQLLFYRICANFKLYRIQRVRSDLHKILLIDRGNTRATQLLRSVSLTQMSEKLHSIFVVHRMRRTAMEIQPTSLKHLIFVRSDESIDDENAVVSKMHIPLLRILCLSERTAKTMQFFMNYTWVIGTQVKNRVDVKLSPWFVCKRMNWEPSLHGIILIQLHKRTAQLMLNLANPENSVFMFWDSPNRDGIFSIYPFKEVIYNDEIVNPNDELLKIVEQNMKWFTRIVYIPDLLNFADLDYPNANYIIVPQKFTIESGFLKIWKTKKLKMKCLIFRKNSPDLASFEKFSGTVSSQLTDLYLPFTNANSKLEATHLETFCANLNLLKRCFPSLINITGTYQCRIFVESFSDFINNSMKEQIRFLADNFTQTLLPGWIMSFRLFLKVYIFVSDQQTFNFNRDYIQKLKQIIGKCQQEISTLNWIRLCGPSLASFDHFHWRPGFALIEMENNSMQAQIVFKTLFED